MTAAASLTPATVEGRAFRAGRFGLAFGPRFFILLAAGLMWAAPMLVDARFLYALIAWDLLILAAWAIDLRLIPPPSALTIARAWRSPLALAEATEGRVTVSNASTSTLRVHIVDALPAALGVKSRSLEVTSVAAGSVEVPFTIQPQARGAFAVGDAYLRYGTSWGLAERWARAPLSQPAIVYPSLGEARRESLATVRARQREGRRRTQSSRGAGRIFDSLREYQRGDEVRDICWTASARRTRLVTKTYVIEPSQHVWLVVDAGRLMRTRVTTPGGAALPKLDRAVNAALALAQVALDSGDRVGVLAYGRRFEAFVPGASKPAHLRQVVEQLARVTADELEADHLLAARHLMTTQKRRALMVWITDLPDMAATPDVVKAAMLLMPRHLVLFAAMGQPDLARVAAERPDDVEDMYVSAAAQGMMHRRELLLARLRREGAMAFDVENGLSSRLINAYMDVKQRGLI